MSNQIQTYRKPIRVLHSLHLLLFSALICGTCSGCPQKNDPNTTVYSLFLYKGFDQPEILQGSQKITGNFPDWTEGSDEGLAGGISRVAIDAKVNDAAKRAIKLLNEEQKTDFTLNKVLFCGSQALGGSNYRLIVKLNKAKGAPDSPDKYSQIEWSTQGGGQKEFSITPDGDNFKVLLKSSSFSRIGTEAILRPENQEAYNMVSEVFSGKRNFNQDTFVPLGPTGSWTSINLIDVHGNSKTIKNISSASDLNKIVDFVLDQCMPKEKLLVWQTTGGGQIRFTVKQSKAAFKVAIGSYGPFKAMDVEITEGNKNAFEILTKVFETPTRFEKAEPEQKEADSIGPQPVTGTWTEVWFLTPDQKTLDLNQTLEDFDLGDVYTLVYSEAEKRLPPLETTGPEPPPVPLGPQDK